MTEQQRAICEVVANVDPGIFDYETHVKELLEGGYDVTDMDNLLDAVCRFALSKHRPRRTELFARASDKEVGDKIKEYGFKATEYQRIRNNIVIAEHSNTIAEDDILIIKKFEGGDNIATLDYYPITLLFSSAGRDTISHIAGKTWGAHILRDFLEARYILYQRAKQGRYPYVRPHNVLLSLGEYEATITEYKTAL